MEENLQLLHTRHPIRFEIVFTVQLFPPFQSGRTTNNTIMPAYFKIHTGRTSRKEVLGFVHKLLNDLISFLFEQLSTSTKKLSRVVHQAGRVEAEVEGRAMRYAAPVAMPAGLGEWLGAELEARGVEAASLYARAVLSILLHSEVAEAEAELDPDRDPMAWNPRAALDMELRLERHTKETRRGRPAIRRNYAPKSGQPKRSQPAAAANRGKSPSSTAVRRRPHSWNGDEEALKKCAAIECLLSATDDGQWGPVEKLVDELCSRLKLLQLEQNGGAKHRWTTGGSAPECAEGLAISPPSDSDSFTSVSSPEGDLENYRQAFPPLDCLSDSDQVRLLCPSPFSFGSWT